MSNIPSRFPAVATDRALHLMERFANTMLNLEMEFDHALDEDRLARALALLFDAEPILGCRYVPDPWRPYWARLESVGERLLFTRDPADFAAFLPVYLDPRHEPPYKVCLLREAGGDRLLLKIAHNVGDAGGIKHVAAALSDLYTRLRDDPDYRPLPNVEGSRDTWQIIRQIPRRALPKIYFNFLKTQYANLRPAESHCLSTNGQRGDPPVYQKHRFDRDAVRRLAAYGRRFGATFNDLLITAFIRAIFRLGDWNGQAGLRLATTVDFRRHYLPTGRAEAICNLSGFEYTNLGHNLGRDFQDTLTTVALGTRDRKANYPGLNDYIGVIPLIALFPPVLNHRAIDGLFDIARRKKMLPNVFTNMGPIEPAEVMFDRPPVDAWIHGPQAHPPMLAVGMTGYAGSLTISIGHLPTPENRTLIADLFTEILNELPT